MLVYASTTSSHIQLFKWLLCCINNTNNFRLPIQHGDLTLTTYLDSNWAKDSINKSLSSLELSKSNHLSLRQWSGDRAFTATTMEVIWLRCLLLDFHISTLDWLLPIVSTNMSTIVLTKKHVIQVTPNTLK